MSKAVNSSSSLVRGLSLLQAVVDSPRALSLTELVKTLGLPKPTVHRMALQLELEGLLQRSPMDKSFMVGPNLKQLALSTLSNSLVGAARHAILEALSQEIGETCNCTMLDGNQVVYFDRAECNWPIKINLHPGSRLPLHATASGKLFLAYMKPQIRKRLLEAAPLSRNTNQTIVSPKLLEEELKTIKADGISYDNEELITGMVAAAVPVFDKSNNVCFTVAVHAPTARMQIEDLRQWIPSLRRAASSLAASYCDSEQE